MIRVKEPTANDRRVGVTHAPYAFTRKVIPEVLYGNGDAPKKTVTKSPARAKKRAKNKPQKGGVLQQGQEKAPVPAPATGAGRPKLHATAADRQRAYRKRQKEGKR